LVGPSAGRSAAFTGNVALAFGSGKALAAAVREGLAFASGAVVGRSAAQSV
jgi:hypothetical protein